MSKLDPRPICLILFGPTASGKSAMAMAIADAFRGTVINADSMQVYRDLRVITARPSEEEESQVPHRLYGHLDASEISSAAGWREDAVRETRSAIHEGRLPILCGGTGFYLRAITHGLSPIPEIPDAIRMATRTQVEDGSPVRSWERLQEIDPASAARIEPMDRQRIARALEVFEATGRTLTDWQSDPPEGAPTDIRFVTMTLAPPRDQLVRHIENRFEHMVAHGALDEVAALLDRNLPDDRPALRAVGVPELASHIRGEQSLDCAIEAAKIATRQYAKRQMTWLKRQIVSDFTKNTQYSKSLDAEIFAFIEENGLIRS